MERLKHLGGLLVGVFFAMIGSLSVAEGRFFGLKSHRWIEGTPARVLGGLVLIVAILGIFREVRELIGGKPASAPVEDEGEPTS